MAFVQYGYQSEADRAADGRQRDAMRLIKEIGQWQAVIVSQLEQYVRGADPKGVRERIAEASNEYGIRLKAIMNSSPPRISGPSQ
jgi:hypothetical protein